MTVSLCCFFKQKTAYVMRISDWSSDVCSSDLVVGQRPCDGDPGAFGDAELPDGPVDVDGWTRAGKTVTSDLLGLGPVDLDACDLGVGAPEHDVLGDAQVVHQAEVLVDEPHFEQVGRGGRPELELSPPDRGGRSPVGGGVTGADL